MRAGTQASASERQQPRQAAEQKRERKPDRECGEDSRRGARPGGRARARRRARRHRTLRSRARRSGRAASSQRSSNARPRHAIGPPRCARPITARTPRARLEWPCSLTVSVYRPFRVGASRRSTWRDAVPFRSPELPRVAFRVGRDADHEMRSGARLDLRARKLDVADAHLQLPALLDRRAVARGIGRPELQRVCHRERASPHARVRSTRRFRTLCAGSY